MDRRYDTWQERLYRTFGHRTIDMGSLTPRQRTDLYVLLYGTIGSTFRLLPDAFVPGSPGTPAFEMQHETAAEWHLYNATVNGLLSLMDTLAAIVEVVSDADHDPDPEEHLPTGTPDGDDMSRHDST